MQNSVYEVFWFVICPLNRCTFKDLQNKTPFFNLCDLLNAPLFALYKKISKQGESENLLYH